MSDNNDGITVIDVTDPESPAYCFVSIRGLASCENGSGISTMTPLSATQYLRSYYPKDDSETLDESRKQLEQSVLNTLRPFESVRMITIDMLAEAWPGEYTSNEPKLEPKESSTSLTHVPPSLVELTFIPALNHAIQTGETDSLDPLIPGNVSKIKETLRVHDPLSAIGFALLSKVIAVEVMQTKSIDLSHFSLTGEQLIELSSAHECVEVLNISHMQQITTAILRRLIPILPNLRRLVLWNTIPDADVLSLLSESPELFYNIDSLIHPVFFGPLGQGTFTAFSHITTKETQISIASLPYFTPGQLVQALTDYLSLFRAGNGHNSLMLMSCEIPILTAYASAVREPGRSWSERIVPFIPTNSYGGLNECAGWLFTWSEPHSLIQPTAYRYAFTKINKEVREECQRRIHEYRVSLADVFDLPQIFEAEPDADSDDNSGAKTTLSNEELHAKENDIKSEHADQQSHIFDVKSFFQELVKEGRPAPSSEALTKLLELFAALEEKVQDRYSLRLMTPADLTSIREVQARLLFIQTLSGPP